MNWASALIDDQLGFYWNYSLWPRLEGLTDEEYLWEPVADCWSVRPDEHGAMRIDGHGVWPHPAPPPFTTLAWRIVHIAVGVFYTRASTFFGDGSVPADADMADPRHYPERLPANAAEAVGLLEKTYRWWTDGVREMTDERLLEPLGPRGGFYADQSMAQLVLHLNRETMHHGGEIGTLRDLYRSRATARWSS
ncbi:DinB family protein [Actinoplanes sp. NPDC051411]|uniref:DinB family protein n=1 Tax=Actinoplanes sp. NPDC051411 TaxID=3155522 RepID=UPI00344AE903